MTIRVLLADDQPLIRAGFRMFVEPDPEVEVVGEAGTGREAVELARSERADVVLMDLRMPGMDGIEATRRIAESEDLAGVRVLVLTTFENDDNVVLALRAGASGFLGKHVDPAELLRAIRVVAAGESLLSPAATRGLVSRFLSQPVPSALPAALELGALTEREREVLALVAHGLSNDEIGERLYVSPLTVKTHINRAMTKLGVRDRAQLVVIAYQSGLVRPGEQQP
ncbi:response regulator [Amorphoplanes digitatis]|uniref:DNA-binding NarL/FixJ family response regulator n=1 Tax=Actinoplanes digitatis TaxID=1868 RepID=A0A7W7I5B1_9ACTN|nr:response regulator transcription factor [Actinoplanes digitatis]MBB4766737.1 DNA-binding NarL/FixJ family response regulator [Actinoplanes digitatis]BFE76896.1 response regulator transcription factor [Actinoplanes digitatis]GID96657.1 DNA-binding response regulator [Actinoplanes digitatis]